MFGKKDAKEKDVHADKEVAPKKEDAKADKKEEAKKADAFSVKDDSKEEVKEGESLESGSELHDKNHMNKEQEQGEIRPDQSQPGDNAKPLTHEEELEKQKKASASVAEGNHGEAPSQAIMDEAKKVSDAAAAKVEADQAKGECTEKHAHKDFQKGDEKDESKKEDEKV